MKRFLLLLLLSGCTVQAEPAKPDPVKVVLPDPTPVPVPPPPPSPSAITKLPADRLYVVQSDSPLLVFDIPLGLLKITKETGPLKVMGKFVDGPDQYEVRTYNAKYIALVTAVGKGQATLLIVPDGTKSESEAIRRVIDAGGVGPTPPTPVPPDPVPPTPEPTDPLWQPLKAAFQSDPNQQKAKDLAKIYRMASETTLYDKDVTTDAHLLAIMSSAADKAIGKLPSFEAVRRVLGDESNKIMKPTNLTKLTDERRDAWLKLFIRYALLLEQLK